MIERAEVDSRNLWFSEEEGIEIFSFGSDRVEGRDASFVALDCEERVLFEDLRRLETVPRRVE